MKMQILKHTHLTEKAMNNVESLNELVFVADIRASKPEIKKAIEDQYKVKIIRINTLIDQKKRKKVTVRLSEETPAIDIATRLGMI
ncbi:MAG: 50S ribosomal protein L23 [Candidatus Aenigmarchaeota archaeon]|nr:50S ribosomal protein L23 [Candidatus Aenigmarchaeota archaeon]